MEEQAKVTTQAALVEFHEKLASQARKLLKAKNQDYANDKDIFQNFRRHGRYGILVRMDDKIMRLGNLLEKGRCTVEDESVLDTVIDLVNYAVLFAAYSDLEK